MGMPLKDSVYDDQYLDWRRCYCVQSVPGYDWLAFSHLSMLTTFATWTKKCEDVSKRTIYFSFPDSRTGHHVVEHYGLNLVEALSELN